MTDPRIYERDSVEFRDLEREQSRRAKKINAGLDQMASPASDLRAECGDREARDETKGVHNSARIITVTRESHLFVLRVNRAGEIVETVRALDAQMILDYLRGTWPVGTIASWRILA